ncbi:unnamed protein product [Rotaria sp. Silwood2]|nr:unnamed protein product [Rotaria sp. Silwood2]CAF2759016.1 unnamed protein product [Rotaria sp. Silwood2]CAF3127013.1 unnamed protein product [Rotaria sp. Silwood2]CAF4139375.1 unnamed protein product [Rotaria sp. Silwood2]CAF4298080.1 unnamed protein product [Rotaria sp. Silwood2]
MIGRTLLVAGCIDRYALCSNYQRFRSLNNPKVALRIIIVIVIAWLCINIYIPFVMTFTGNNCLMLGSTALIWAIYTVVVPGILTPVLMSTFGLLAIRNRRRLQGRLNGNRNYGNKRDYTLTVMLLSEVLVYILSTSFFPTTTLYKAVTTNVVKSVQRQRIENFVIFLGSNFLLFINPSATFYIFIIASRSYRQECKRVFLGLYMRLTRRMNKVATIATTNTLVDRHNETHI